MSTKLSHRKTLSARKLTLFWQEKYYTIVVLVRCCGVKTSQENGSSFGIF